MSGANLPEWWRKEFPALFGDRSPNPIADRWEAAQRPHVRTLKPGGELTVVPAHKCSPGARLHAQISAGVDRSKHLPIERPEDEHWPPPWAYSNIGRRVLPEGHYTERSLTNRELLKAEQAGGDAVEGVKQRIADYGQVAETARYGGQPIETVILHSPRGIGNLEFLVAPGWSQRRVSQFVSHGIRDCFWCDHMGTRQVPIDSYMLVGCGATLRIYPTCDACEARFARDFGGGLGLDYQRAWDDWFVLVGCPSDEYV